MSTWIWIVIVLAFLLISFGIFAFFFIGYYVYTHTLKRLNKDQWSRNPVFEREDSRAMDDLGQAWHKANLEYKKEIHIVNRDGLNLYGEFYDFGADKTVMILSGRTESLRYGYFFAKPYADFGMNVVVLDPRAHGMSDGEYNTVGFEESKDILEWVDYLQKNHNPGSIIFHGICIGSSGGIHALTADSCPDCVKGMVAEGMFARFGESMKNNLIVRKKPVFPVLQSIDFWMKHYTGHSMMKGPINIMHKMHKPLLMLHSKQDRFSTPSYAQELYEICPAENKEIVWFDTGDHSFLRITHMERYDACINAYLKRVFS